MRRLIAPLLVSTFALACSSEAPTTASPGDVRLSRLGGAAQGGRLFTAVLSGANEVSATGVAGVGDPDGTGTARVTVNVGRGQLCYEIAVASILLPAAAAHIHEAPAGTNGPVIVPLAAPDASGVSGGCASVSREFAKELAKDPAGYYVNVHNSVYPGGAVRGQLD